MRSIAQGRADAIVDVVDFLGEHMNKHKNVEWQVVDKAIDTWYSVLELKRQLIITTMVECCSLHTS